MNKISHCLTIIILLYSTLHAENLTNKYKSLMKNNSPQQEEYKPTPASSHTDISSNTSEITKNITDTLKEIKNLKQGTFESTKEFETRVNAKLEELNSKIKFYSQKGSKDLSAGTVTMKSYDADNEKMALNLRWDSQLNSIFPEIKNYKTATLLIPRDEARKLFDKQDNHPFHIEVVFESSKLKIGRIVLYGGYVMRATEKESAVKKDKSNPYIGKQNNVNRTVPMEQKMQQINYKEKIKYIDNDAQINQKNLQSSLVYHNSRTHNYPFVCYDKK